ncbi:MAG: sensor histidine kinase, partial [Acetivibrio ethanolgignens]
MEKKAGSFEKEQNIKNIENSKLYLLEIQEMEQKRISNELHDTTVQNLTMLIHKAELCKQLADRDIVQTKLELQMMKETLRKTIQELRNIIFNLRPMSVDDLGLVETIERFITQREFEDDSMNITFEVTGKEPKGIKSIITMTLFRVIQELYNNAKKHARCKEFEICISFDAEKIEIKVSDDGMGFEL